MLRRVWGAVVELLFPSQARCAGCGDLHGADAAFLCEDCAAQFTARYDIVRGPNWPKDGIWQAYTAFRYQDAVRGALHTYKFRCVRALSEPFAEGMIGAYRSLVLLRPDVIVPIPLHKKRMFERGFNQAELLARRLSEALDIPCEPLIERARYTKQQSRLGHEARALNTAGAFRVSGQLGGRSVMLVDDVLTTGSTANACAVALRAAGAGEVTLIAAANASPHRPADRSM